MRTRRFLSLIATAITASIAVACSPSAAPDRVSPSSPTSTTSAPLAATTETPATEPTTTEPTTTEPTTTEPTTTRAAPEPRRSFLTIPRLGLRDFPVIRYRGSPDDAEGTRLQNDGSLASPRGPGGGEAPGDVGNYIVTGHRLSSTEPFRYLPSLPVGSRVLVRVAGTVHVYEIRRTRWTSFRSSASLRAQRASVPGRPGIEASRPMVTLSTCATIEDHAAGNYWADEFDNPEHRIDKIGVLVGSRDVTG